jgi:hypothetical protein
MNNAGAAYIYKRDVNGQWNLLNKINSGDREYDGRFGMSVVINGSTCIVGADAESEKDANNKYLTFAGSVYVFNLVDGKFKFSQKIVTKDLKDGDAIGRHLVFKGDNLLVSSTTRDVVKNNDGAIYLFKLKNGVWTENQMITHNNPSDADLFGINCDMSGEDIISGDYFQGYDENNANYVLQAGAVYFFGPKICTPTSVIISKNNCSDFVSPSGRFTWKQSGIYKDTLVNKDGCDSIITINLTIGAKSSSEVKLTACDSIIINNQVYKVSGDYQQILTSKLGCDSSVTYKVQIFNTSNSVFIDTACNNYSWNNINYTNSGEYIQKFKNANNCDSIVKLKLTLKSFQKTTNLEGCEGLIFENKTFTKDTIISRIHTAKWV